MTPMIDTPPTATTITDAAERYTRALNELEALRADVRKAAEHAKHCLRVLRQSTTAAAPAGTTPRQRG